MLIPQWNDSRGELQYLPVLAAPSCGQRGQDGALGLLRQSQPGVPRLARGRDPQNRGTAGASGNKRFFLYLQGFFLAITEAAEGVSSWDLQLVGAEVDFIQETWP